MMEADDLLPPVSPKGFEGVEHPAPSQAHVSFASESPSSRLGKSKARNLGLSLRRITPDKKSKRDLQSSPSHGEGSFVSRITGRSSRSKMSIHTNATPVMRGGTRAGSIERRQKMEDEYYSPGMQWAEEEEEEEALEDGELPSLKRVGSNGSWNRNRSHRTSEGIEVYGTAPVETSARPSRAARAAAAAAALVTPTERGRQSTKTSKEQLKVAGFWSQLDDDGDAAASSNSDDEGSAPGDEKEWRRSRSPPRDRAAGQNHEPDDGASSIGLDLVSARDDDDDREEGASPAPASKDKGETKSESKWNLLEKAACYAHEGDSTTYREDEASASRATDRFANDRYAAAMEDEDEDQSLDRAHATTARSATNNKAKRGEGAAPDDEEEGWLPCLTAALTTMCGYEAAAAVNHACGGAEPSSPAKQRAHEIIARDGRRRGALVSDGESTEGGSVFDDLDDAEAEDVAVELRYHAANDPTSPPATPKKKKRGLRKFIANPLKRRKDPPRRTVVTTTTRSGREAREGYAAQSKLTDYLHSMTFEEEILGEGEEEGGGAPPPPDEEPGSPTSVAAEDLDAEAEGAKEESGGERTAAAAAAAAAATAAAATAGAALAAGRDRGGDPDDERELESEAAAWSTNKKNDYLRQLAARAKMEYASQAGSSRAADHVGAEGRPSGDDATAEEEESTIGSINPAATGDAGVPDGMRASHNTADYHGLAPGEKRRFLRLLNAGMAPGEAAEAIAAERGRSPVAIDEEGEDAPEEEEEDGPAVDEMPRLASEEEGAAPSADADDDDARALSSSERAQASSRASSRGGLAALAAIPLVPAMVRAKRRSKGDKARGARGEAHDDDDDDEEAEEPPPTTAYVADDGGEEEPPATAADGLLASGIGYYDGADRGLDPAAPAAADDAPDDAGLLGAADAASPRSGTAGKSRTKLRGAAAAGALAAKVASRTRKSGYRSVARDDAYDAAAAPGAPRGHDHEDGTKSDASARSSSRSLAAALHLVNNRKERKEKNWARLDSDAALDRVQPSRTRSAEEGGEAPSWLLPRDDEMEGEDGVADGRDKDSVFDDDEEPMQDEDEGEDKDSQAPSWSPSLSPEMTAAAPREAAKSPPPTEAMSPSPGTPGASASPGTTLGSEAESRDAESEAGDARAVTPGHDDEEEDAAATAPRPSPVGSSRPFDERGALLSDDQSHATFGSSWTTATQSSRKRHKGAAPRRIKNAREAEGHAGPANRGWLGSIRDAASNQGQAWDPERGWVDYYEPEEHREDGRDYRGIGELHLPHTPRGAYVLPATPEEEAEYLHRPKSVGVPSRGEKEGETVAAARAAAAPREAAGLSQDDDSIFDAATVHTAAETSVLSYSTAAAPTHRSKPKAAPTDMRKVRPPTKPMGWKESMEHATANFDGTGRRWDYRKGWVDAEGNADDDMSELTRNTVEKRSPKEGGAAGQGSHIGQFDVGAEDAISQLPSVAEAMDEVSDVAVSEVDKEKGGVDRNYISAASSEEDDYAATEDAPSADRRDPDAPETPQEERLRVARSGSDKENDTLQEPPAKRSLNRWIEKTNSEAEEEPHDDSMEAVPSDSFGSPPPSRSPFSGEDPFGDSDLGAMREVQVVKEHLSDADSDLFQPAPIITASFMKTIGGLIDSHDDRAKAQEPRDSPTWAPSQPVQKEDEGATTEQSVSSRAQAWMSSVEKRSQMAGMESDASGTNSEAPQVNTVEPAQNLDPPSSGYAAGTRNAKKASDSWIRSKKELETDEEPAREVPASTSWIRKDLEQDETEPPTAQTGVGGLRTMFENKGSAPVVPTEDAAASKPVFVQTNNAKENDVYFRSSAMGIRLKRGEDGFVRVVSVTEATAGSSIVRDGMIDPEDRIMEAAGVDLRKPITNSQWGETVTKIRNAPRPMKFVVAGGPRRQEELVASAQQTVAPAKFTMESRLSKSPEGQQVLHSLSQAGAHSSSASRTKSTTTKSTDRAEETVTSNMGETEDEQPPQGKESFFKRMAACATPVVSQCAAPGNKSTQDSSQGQDGGSVPMAHLQFLRTNPTIARVTDAASKRYPALCGRPDTIFEEPNDDDTTRDRSSSAYRAYAMNRSRSGASSTTSESRSYAATQATLSTYDKTAYTADKTEYTDETGSENNNNAAFLDQLANKPSVASQPARPSQKSLSDKLGKHTLAPYTGGSQGSNEVGWPTDNDEPSPAKDTIETHSSSYKKETARQAELIAASKVEDMMKGLDHVDPDSESEI